MMITSFEDSALYFWNLDTYEVEDKINLPPNANITQVAMSLDSNYVLAA